MLREISKQSIHLREIGAVNQVASLLLDIDQAGVRELLQMKRQRVTGHAELIGQDTGGKPGKAGHHQSAERAQPLGVSKA
ncbi:hypothetical protein GCM10027288_12000 [Bordetella tumbae]